MITFVAIVIATSAAVLAGGAAWKFWCQPETD
jgi:hypothetical protein